MSTEQCTFSIDGFSTLPYKENFEWIITEHLSCLTSSYPSFHSSTTTTLSSDDNVSAAGKVLTATGDIPIYITDYPSSYVSNICILISLEEEYPENPPRVFLMPPTDYKIKKSHPYMDMESRSVSTPYLKKWDFYRPPKDEHQKLCNLVDLVEDVITRFCREPPVEFVGNKISSEVVPRSSKPSVGFLIKEANHLVNMDRVQDAFYWAAIAKKLYPSSVKAKRLLIVLGNSFRKILANKNAKSL